MAGPQLSSGVCGHILATEQEWAGMPGAVHRGVPSVRMDRDHAQRREDLFRPTLQREDLIQCGQQRPASLSSQDQGAPCHAQAYAQRCLVGAVPAHVPDHQVDRAVGGLDRVVEVTPEQRASPAWAVARVVTQRGVVQLRNRQ